MPLQTKVCLLFFTSMPLWALASVIWQHSGAPLSSLRAIELVTMATYGLCPWLISLSIWRRSMLLLPLFLAQCALLCIHTFMNPTEAHANLQFIRWLVLIVASISGFLLVNRDFLYPLLSKNRRRWRVAPRFSASAQIEIYNAQQLITLASVIDCSKSGLGLLLPRDTAEHELRPVDGSTRIHIRYHQGSKTFEVPVRLVWSQDQSTHLRIGFQALSSEAMSELFTILKESPPKHSWSTKIMLMWSKKHLRRAAFLIWIASLGLAFGLPSCQANDIKTLTSAPISSSKIQ